MSHPASPRQCPKCLDHAVLAEPVWEDVQPTGRELDVCRSCGPVETPALDETAAKPRTAKK